MADIEFFCWKEKLNKVAAKAAASSGTKLSGLTVAQVENYIMDEAIRLFQLRYQNAGIVSGATLDSHLQQKPPTVVDGVSYQFAGADHFSGNVAQKTASINVQLDFPFHIEVMVDA